MRRNLIALVLLLAVPSMALAVSNPEWAHKLSALPIQDGGRVMPLDTYARNLAVQLTGRSSWSAEKGPEGYRGKAPVELVFDLAFHGEQMIHKPLVIIENAAFKKAAGLDVKRRFFSPVELGQNKAINDMLIAHMQAKQSDPDVRPTPEQNIALEVQRDLERIGMLVENPQLPIVPGAAGKEYLRVGPRSGERGTEKVVQAFAALGQAYVLGQGLDSAADEFVKSVQAAGTVEPHDAQAVGWELKYNKYRPWLMTAMLYGLALVIFGASRLMLRKPLVILGALVTLLGVAAHIGGLSLRVMILNRAPVSNTYEALLWMGLVAIAVGLVAQLVNRKAMYFAAGVSVALLSVLFSNLVPLDNQTGSLPAVLRSNYWLIIHVLTITASYGVLAVASIIGHVYLIKEVLVARRLPQAGKLSHPLIVQIYRSMQLGLVLLTAGTILGGVWAADSWGRFWGWDPKETWALISIIVYFIILHARYLRWIQDFGMAVAAVLSFASIVWTFYGVNYLMASGLHSYGFGHGGGSWVAVYALAEIVLVLLCYFRFRQLKAADAAKAV